MMSQTDGLEEKVGRLRGILEDMSPGVLVAFSGGADSALLAYEGAAAMGDSCVAVTADTPTLPRAELQAAVDFARMHGIRHEIVATREMRNPRFVANDAYRCFYCKQSLFETMARLAEEKGLPWILYGAIADDVGDWRPGMDAAKEAGVRAPLLEAGFRKDDVRQRSRDLALGTWDKPASACLSSRFPTGRPITLQDLSMVEKAETALHELGFRQCRVRLMDDAARIEVEDCDLARFIERGVREEICETLRGLGFRFVTVDLDGFRSGSLNPLNTEKRHGIRR
jgi:uncharacterized protein